MGPRLGPISEAPQERRRLCEERSDEAIQKRRCNMPKRRVFWLKRCLDCFASLAMTGEKSFFSSLLE
jgi:hypothetical protein